MKWSNLITERVNMCTCEHMPRCSCCSCRSRCRCSCHLPPVHPAIRRADVPNRSITSARFLTGCFFGILTLFFFLLLSVVRVIFAIVTGRHLFFSGSFQDLFRIFSGYLKDSYQDRDSSRIFLIMGMNWDSFRDPCRVLLGSFQEHFRMFQGSLQYSFRIFSGLF